MRRTSRVSRLSSPAIRAVMPDASLEVFSISSDSINVMFFHEPNQSSAPLHASATCLYWAHRMGRLRFTGWSWHVCKTLAAIALSKPLVVFFFAKQTTLSAFPFLTLRKRCLFYRPNNSHTAHSGVLEMLRMLLTLSMQLQRAAATPGGVS